ncbi:branched-chain amino acid ABC transporter substrate-binding protein [Cupriavidus basilensis]
MYKRLQGVAIGLIVTAMSMTARAEDTITIGFAGPLTGMSSGYGKDLENGVRLAIEDANAKGTQLGSRRVKFELVSQDDQADPRIGVQAAQNLVDRQVAAVVGHFNSGTTIPASMVYDKAGIPMVNPAATNPAITGRGLANVFMTIANDAQNAGNAGVYAVQTTKAKRIAILDDRTAFGQGEADEFERAVKAQGGSIVAREYTNNQTSDFSSVLTSIKAKNVDLLFFGGLDRQAAQVVKKMKQLRMNAQFLAGGAVANGEFLKLAGDSGDGAMAWEYGVPPAKMPGGEDFAKRYRTRFGTDVLSYAPFGYDAALTIIEAMKKAGSSKSDDFRPMLKTIKVSGVTGYISFENSGALKNATSTLYQVREGKWVPVVTRGQAE